MGEARRRRAAGLPPRGRLKRLEAEMARAQIQASDEILKENGLTVQGIINVAANAQGFAAERASEAAERVPPRPACQAGCAWCCSLPVAVLAPEVLLIAAWLRQHRMPEDYSAVLIRVQAASAQIAGLRLRDRLISPSPCPLLEDNRCSVYPVRPGTCVSWNATDAADCETFYRTGDDTSPYKMNAVVKLTEVISVMAAQVLTNHGAPQVEPLELIHALRIAMERPDAAESWLRGEPIFASAQRSADERRT